MLSYGQCHEQSGRSPVNISGTLPALEIYDQCLCILRIMVSTSGQWSIDLVYCHTLKFIISVSVYQGLWSVFQLYGQ